MNVLPANYHRVDFPFLAIEEKELETERLLASLKSMGMSGSMYGRDDMEDMMAGYDEDELDLDSSANRFGASNPSLNEVEL